MRVLVIAAYPLFPAHAGGKIRTVELARGLVRSGCEVTLVTPYSPRQPWQPGLRQVPYPFVWTLLTDRPFPYAYLTSFHPGFDWMARPFFAGYDIYQFEHVQFASLLRLVPPGKKVVYSAHNVEVDYVRSECRKPWLRELVGRRIAGCEQRLLKRADLVVTVSQADATRFESFYGLGLPQSFIIPNGIQGSCRQGNGERVWEKFPALRGYSRIAIFCGSNVLHNREAVSSLLGQTRADVGLVIQGGCGQAFRGSGHPHVFFDSDDDLADFAAVGAIGLNPVTQGGGTNLKLLHYLAHGMRVVSSEFGMRGYEGLKDFVQVTSPLEVIGALQNPLPDPPFRPELEHQYGWSRLASRLEQRYRGLIT